MRDISISDVGTQVGVFFLFFEDYKYLTRIPVKKVGMFLVL